MLDATQILYVSGNGRAGEIERTRIERPNHGADESANAAAGSPPDRASWSSGTKTKGFGPRNVDLLSGTRSNVNLTAQQLRIMIDAIPAFAWSCPGGAELLSAR